MRARAEAKAAADAAEKRARRAEKARLVEWFHGAALLEVCLFYWQHQLCDKFSYRRSVRARVAAQRCNLEDSEPSDMLASILPRLAEEHAAKLRADFAVVDALLKDGVQENYSEWIETIGRFGDPPQHVFLQHMGRMVQTNLRQIMDPGCAEALTTALLEKAQRKDSWIFSNGFSVTPAKRTGPRARRQRLLETAEDGPRRSAALDSDLGRQLRPTKLKATRKGAGESPAGPSGSAATIASAPSEISAPSPPSTEGENKRGQEWETGKGADKFRRSEQVQGGGSGSGWGSKKQNDWWKNAKKDFEEKAKAEKDVEEIKNLCVSLSRLVLRHDDQQAIDRTEKGFIMFCQTSRMLSVIPDLVRTIEAWTKMKEENPTGLTLPRRSAMLKQLLDLWYVRLEVVAETEESLRQARTMLILDQAGRIPYLQYNRQTEQLEIKTDRDPMELKAALECIKELQDLVLLPFTTLHFHAARWEFAPPKQTAPGIYWRGFATAEQAEQWQAGTTASESLLGPSLRMIVGDADVTANLNTFFIFAIITEIALLILPIILSYLEIAKEYAKMQKDSDSEDGQDVKPYSFLQWEAKKFPYEFGSWGGDKVNDFLDMAINYSVVACWGVIYPPMAAIAAIALFILLRLRIYRSLYVTRRPLPRASAGLGIWRTIFQCINVTAVACNVGLAALFFYPMRTRGFGHQLMFFLIFEHAILILQATVKFLISDSPVDVTNIGHYNEYVKKTMKKKMANDIYPAQTSLRHVDVSLNPDNIESEADSDSS
ncbi:Ano10 [Symbiodinium necroappetens]|uniref:Ano10 protein n=1 Tax=Symbiodinium necroappetens TaxID=1628268 RepID=A0A813ALF5_9DINO|nr:Ano10 [Symbiodinium necroappetens]